MKWLKKHAHKQTDDLGAVATADCWDHADQWQYMTACERNQVTAM